MTEQFYFAIKDGLAECWASGPTLELAEIRVRTYVKEYVINHPKEGPIENWSYAATLPPVDKAYQKAFEAAMAREDLRSVIQVLKNVKARLINQIRSYFKR